MNNIKNSSDYNNLYNDLIKYATGDPTGTARSIGAPPGSGLPWSALCLGACLPERGMP